MHFVYDAIDVVGFLFAIVIHKYALRTRIFYDIYQYDISSNYFIILLIPLCFKLRFIITQF